MYSNGVNPATNLWYIYTHTSTISSREGFGLRGHSHQCHLLLYAQSCRQLCGRRRVSVVSKSTSGGEPKQSWPTMSMRNKWVMSLEVTHSFTCCSNSLLAGNIFSEGEYDWVGTCVSLWRWYNNLLLYSSVWGEWAFPAALPTGRVLLLYGGCLLHTAVEGLPTRGLHTHHPQWSESTIQ